MIELWEKDEDGRIIINVGPSHPAMHGTLRVIVELDGEVIKKAEPEIGYLHRGVEKLAEQLTYTSFIPYTDRLNYVSALMNNMPFCMAVEKLLGIDVPRRAQYLRVIFSEFARISDHIICIATNVVDLGALTPYWWMFKIREDIYELFEMTFGARLTHNYMRIGGVSKDIPKEFVSRAKAVLKDLHSMIDEAHSILTGNRIFLERTVGVSAISPEEAIEWGFTGPVLRATGYEWDLRKVQPYSSYEDFDFEIPVGERGDVFDRYMVRMEEMRQSARIIEQALEGLPEGDYIVRDPTVAFPEKEDVYTKMESLIHHFKLVMDGIRVPPGEAYAAVEAANGELGFHIISDGTGKPARVRIRPPCFAIYQAFNRLLQGHLISDLVAVLGSINIVAGELDR